MRSRVRRVPREKREEEQEAITKKIVRRGAKYCVESETTGRSFGCFPTRAQAERRLRQIEAFKQGGEHVHSFNGRTSSVGSGPAHAHSVELADGTVVESTRSDPGEDHVHDIKIDGETITSGPPTEPPDGRMGKAIKGDLPFVLSWTAVAEGVMPPLGASGMPASLERDVPPRFRYWTAKSEHAAQWVRDALVEAQVFGPDNLMQVEEELRRVIKQTTIHLAAEPATESDLEHRPDLEVFAAGFVDSASRSALSVIAGEVVDALDPDRVEKFLAGRRPWLAVIEDGSDRGDAVVELAKSTFRLRTRPGYSFATSEGVLCDPLIAPPPEVTDLVAKVLSEKIQIRKTEDEQFVLGIVLEPEEEDTQQDVISEEEIRKTAHQFMRDFRQIGLMHRQLITEKVAILESFVAPVAFDIGKEHVKKGTWLLGLFIGDLSLWGQVKRGELDAMSIGGDAIRKPEPRAA